ncbi:MAG: hypothetical protein JRC90_04740 [Deltaproteobacteria bacterium]|nr:hypothetical protein [Deltaproteobacteria bacterium]
MKFTEKVRQRIANRSTSDLCDLELVMGNEDQRRAFHLRITDLQKNFPRIKYDLTGNASGAGKNDVDALAAGEFLPSIGFMMTWAKRFYPEFMGSGSPLNTAIQENLDRLSRDEGIKNFKAVEQKLPSRAAVQRDLKKLSEDKGLKDMNELAKTLKTKQGERTYVKTFAQVVQAYIGLGNTRGGAVKQAVKSHSDLHARYLEDLQTASGLDFQSGNLNNMQTFEEMVRKIKKDRGLSSRAEATKALCDECLNTLNEIQ